jgi:putative colanic acid biosynthesis acetyltransferase WcaF
MTIRGHSTNAYSGPSFSLRNRLGRVLWAIVYRLLFRPSPRPFHSWRSFLLRVFGARLGEACHIYPGAVIWAPWNLVCGDQVGVADGVILYNQAPIVLGHRSVISQGTHLCTGSHDYEDAGFPLLAKPIRIGREAWVAAECFVHPNVRIGEGAVVGARSVVTHDLPAWMICAGHPCQPRKPRRMKSSLPPDTSSSSPASRPLETGVLAGS